MKRTIILSIICLAMVFIPVTTLSAQNNGQPDDNQPTTTQQPSVGGSGRIAPSKPEQTKKRNRGNFNKEQGNQNNPSLKNKNKDIFLNDGVVNKDGSHSNEQSDKQIIDEGFHGIVDENEHGDTLSENSSMNTSGFYDETHLVNSSRNDNSLSWIALFVALAAIGFTIYDHIVLHPKKEKRSSRLDRHHEQASNNDNMLRVVNKQCQTLSANISSLNSRIDEVEERINRLQVMIETTSSNVTNVQSTNKSNPSSSGSMILYASSVKGDGFPKDSLTTVNGNYVIAVLTVNDNKGTFVINDYVGAQSFLISNFAYGAGRICDIQQQNSSPTKVQTVRPGTVCLQGNTWKVTSNALVELL